MHSKCLCINHNRACIINYVSINRVDREIRRKRMKDVHRELPFGVKYQNSSKTKVPMEQTSEIKSEIKDRKNENALEMTGS